MAFHLFVFRWGKAYSTFSRRVLRHVTPETLLRSLLETGDHRALDAEARFDPFLAELEATYGRGRGGSGSGSGEAPFSIEKLPRGVRLDIAPRHVPRVPSHVTRLAWKHRLHAVGE